MKPGRSSRAGEADYSLQCVRIPLVLGILLWQALSGCDVIGALPEASTTPLALEIHQTTEVSANRTPAVSTLTPTKDLPGVTPTEVESPRASAATASTPPTQTPLPTPTTPCFRADYLRDIRVLDGSRFDPGEIIFKIWRIKNSGACAWRGDITMHFLAGDPLAGPEDLPLLLYQPGAQLEARLDEKNWSDLRLFEVEPGQEVDLVGFFRAPDEEGEYRSLWQLTGPDGQALGQVYLFLRVRITAESSLRSWSGLWRQRSPEGSLRETGLVLKQDGPSLTGYFYDDTGVPQWLEATVSTDGERVEGAVGELWTDGSVFYLQKLAGGYQFQGRLEGGPFAVTPWCGARGAAQIPLGRCLLPE